jgi:hypothetical protein
MPAWAAVVVPIEKGCGIVRSERVESIDRAV